MSHLDAFVDAVVAPIMASPKRKARMREELLAHLTALCESDPVAQSDPTLSVERAIKCMGDEAAIRTALQASVPRLERYICLTPPDQQPDETDIQYALRFSTAFIVGMFLCEALIALFGISGSLLVAGTFQRELSGLQHTASGLRSGVNALLLVLALQPILWTFCLGCVWADAKVKRSSRDRSHRRAVFFAACATLFVSAPWCLGVYLIDLLAPAYLSFRTEGTWLGIALGCFTGIAMLVQHAVDVRRGPADNTSTLDAA